MPASILFSGHMIDKPDRAEPRFPPELVWVVRQRIHTAIASFVNSIPRDRILGFASGACGGDILFHEECRACGIDTVIVLPFPPEVFIQSSVELTKSDQGHWGRRFRKLWRETPEARREVMDLPHGDDAYARCNERLIGRARAHGQMHLIALWDGKRGGGHGGTADMVANADHEGTLDVFSPQSLKSRL
ncbi:hypothetical protein [Rhizobium leguminosarum]|uniref:hypothetical protein n=1 Tax=Rhizobium leguminosarum TaxID=384 RepID=UPI0014427E0B|nr:hypothetical protein [Rhizobium leguminosarum]NKL98686.1 hypothetical protein [Rhizobium leguminosarum bv. viciae]